MHTIDLATVGFLIVATACGPGGAEDVGEDHGETGETTTDGGDEAIGWAEVRCVQRSGGPVGMARPTGLSDAWAYVIHIDELNRREADGQITFSGSWGADSCAVGTVPSTMFADWRCYSVSLTQGSACYVGDGTWFAASLPECDPTMIELEFDEPAWAPWSCGAEALDDPWDAISCTDDDLACVGRTGNAALLVEPVCSVESYPHISLDDCR